MSRSQTTTRPIPREDLEEPVSLLPPVHPGDVIREDFLKPWRMSAYRLAKGTGLTPIHVSQLLRGQRSVTAATALRLSRFLGCSPRFWMNLQVSHDLRVAERKLAAELKGIQRYHHDGPPHIEDDEEAGQSGAAGEAA